MKTIFLVLALFFTAASSHADRAMAQKYFEHGIELEKVPRYHKATTEFVMALAEDLDFAPAYRELGNCAYAMKDFYGAEYYYRCYLSVYPGDLAVEKFRKGIADAINAAVKPGGKALPTPVPSIAADWDYLKFQVVDVPNKGRFEKSLAAAKAAALKSGKPLLVLAPHTCRKTMSLVFHKNEGSEGAVKMMLHELMNDPEYSEWVNNHFVLGMTDRDKDCFEWLGSLSKASKHGVYDTERAIIVCNSDQSDWRSCRGYNGAESTMLFLIRSARAFATRPSAPHEEITWMKLEPAEGKARITLNEDDFAPLANIYISHESGKNFRKVSPVPSGRGVMYIKGLAMGSLYYLHMMPLDGKGREHFEGPEFKIQVDDPDSD